MTIQNAEKEKEAKVRKRSKNLDGKHLHTETHEKFQGPAEKFFKTPKVFCSDQPRLPPPLNPNNTPRLQSSAPKPTTSDEPQPALKTSTNSKLWRETPPSQSETISETPWPAEFLIGRRHYLEDQGLTDGSNEPD